MARICTVSKVYCNYSPTQATPTATLKLVTFITKKDKASRFMEYCYLQVPFQITHYPDSEMCHQSLIITVQSPGTLLLSALCKYFHQQFNEVVLHQLLMEIKDGQ